MQQEGRQKGDKADTVTNKKGDKTGEKGDRKETRWTQWPTRNYTTVDPKQFVLFKPKLELATSRAGRQRIAYRAGGHILRKN